MRILFITCRNITTSSGELRLIKNRAEYMKKNGIVTDFLAVQKRRKDVRHEAIKSGGTFDVQYLNKNPVKCFFDILSFRRLIKKKMKGKKYEAVILSGVGMPLLCRFINKDGGVKVFIDIHGSCKDVLFLNNNSSFFRKIKSWIIYSVNKLSLRIGLKKANGAMVVTKFLEEYVRDNFKIRDGFRFYIIPCGVSSEYIFSKNEYYNNRRIYRKKYNIDKDDLVFIYSGGTSGWQCLGETIDLYNKIEKILPGRTKLLLLSHNKNEIRKFTEKCDDTVIIDSYEPLELKRVLCVGDYAFLLRKDSIVNKVAFPNKYLEYVLSGMHVITTCFLCEIAYQVKKYKLGVVLTDLDDVSWLKDISGQKIESLSSDAINCVLDINGFDRTMASFLEQFKKEVR